MCSAGYRKRLPPRRRVVTGVTARLAISFRLKKIPHSNLATLGVGMPSPTATANGRSAASGPRKKANGKGAAGKTANGSKKAPTPTRLPITGDTLDAEQLLAVLTAVRRGDFTARMPRTLTGVAGKISDTLNEIIELQEEQVSEMERVAKAVGKEGRITQRASLRNAAGSWSASVASVNTLIADLVQPTSEVARVIGAVAKGDLSQTMSL